MQWRKTACTWVYLAKKQILVQQWHIPLHHYIRCTIQYTVTIHFTVQPAVHFQIAVYPMGVDMLRIRFTYKRATPTKWVFWPIMGSAQKHSRPTQEPIDGGSITQIHSTFFPTPKNFERSHSEPLALESAKRLSPAFFTKLFQEPKRTVIPSRLGCYCSKTDTNLRRFPASFDWFTSHWYKGPLCPAASHNPLWNWNCITKLTKYLRWKWKFSAPHEYQYTAHVPHIFHVSSYVVFCARIEIVFWSVNGRGYALVLQSEKFAMHIQNWTDWFSRIKIPSSRPTAMKMTDHKNLHVFPPAIVQFSGWDQARKHVVTPSIHDVSERKKHDLV